MRSRGNPTSKDSVGVVRVGLPNSENGAMFPVVLRFDGRRALVVGGGQVAARKVDGLLAAGARVTVVSPQIVDAIADQANRTPDRLTLYRRPFIPNDVDGAWYVVAATALPDVQQAVADECERRQIWCNAVDDPQRCTALLPAVHRNGDVLLAISTGGASPTLARVLRDRIAAALPSTLGEMAVTLAERRRVWQAGGLSTEDRDWAPEIDELLAAGLPACPAFRKVADRK